MQNLFFLVMRIFKTYSLSNFQISGPVLTTMGFPSGSVVKNLPANAGDTVLIPKSGRSPGKGNGPPLQYSCLRNPVDRGAWWASVHGVAKSWTQLNTHAMWRIINCSHHVVNHIPKTDFFQTTSLYLLTPPNVIFQSPCFLRTMDAKEVLLWGCKEKLETILRGNGAAEIGCWTQSSWKWKSLHQVWLFVTPCTIESMEFSRKEYWNG